MAKQVSARRVASRKPAQISGNGRQIWLAGLGAVSLARKQALKSYDAVIGGVAEWQARADQAVAAAKDKATALRKQAVTVLTPARKQAQAAIERLEAGLAPVLVRFGVKRPARRAPTKRATRGAKRPVRKAAGKRTRAA